MCMYILIKRIKFIGKNHQTQIFAVQQWSYCFEKWTKQKSQYEILSEKIVILMKMCVYVRVWG